MNQSAIVELARRVLGGGRRRVQPDAVLAAAHIVAVERGRHRR